MSDFDRQHLWHPYTSMLDPLPTYPVRRAEGVFIELETGERLIDGMSSWWCAVHGYNHPALNAAAHRQIDDFAHVMFGGLTHRPAVELGERLLKVLPRGLSRIFYCDSGSVAVEIALKMALQFAQAAGFPGRTKLATIAGGYHGDTWHAMSVCDPVGGMHSLYNGRLPIQFFAPRPPREWSEEAFEPMFRLLEEHGDEIAAVIVEPVVQGAGGMWFYAPEYLCRLREETKKRNILLIADEIATGFWRTGRQWGCDHACISTTPSTRTSTKPLGFPSETHACVPDIMCVGKALTGGYLSFAATVATDEVALTISSAAPHVFMHGPTFMGNPLAAAVACASLDLLADPLLPPRILEIERLLKEELAPARGLKNVADVRVMGAIGVVEMRSQINVERFQRECVRRGVWIRPFGRLAYIMPPYIITDEQLRKLCHELIRIIAPVHN